MPQVCLQKHFFFQDDSKIKYLGLDNCQPAIVQEDTYSTFRAEYTLSDANCDVRYNHWMGTLVNTVGLSNVGFIVDLGCLKRITMIEIRNGHGIYENTSVSTVFTLSYTAKVIIQLFGGFKYHLRACFKVTTLIQLGIPFHI